jgi:hypothetical protein
MTKRLPIDRQLRAPDLAGKPLAEHGRRRLRVIDVARQLDRHPNSVNRWILKGTPLRDGSRLRLNATRTPGGWLVEQRDLDSFLALLTTDALGKPAPIDLKAHDAADRALTEGGW